MYWTLELASYLEDAPWPATKDELIDFAMRTGAPLEVVENLRAHIGRLPFHFSGQPVRVTLSAGLAAFRPGDSETSVFNRADQALYEAKGAGRNQSRTAIA